MKITKEDLRKIIRESLEEARLDVSPRQSVVAMSQHLNNLVRQTAEGSEQHKVLMQIAKLLNSISTSYPK